MQSITTKNSLDRSIPGLSPPSTASPPRSHAEKFRACCDGCGIAKVKCDRCHPECGRCKTLNLTCVYGLSRKFGKPQRKRPGSDVNETKDKRICTSWTGEARDNHTTMGPENTQRIDERSQTNFSDLVTDINPFSFDINTAFGLNEQNQLSSAMYPDLSFGEWPQPDNLGGDLDIPSASTLETFNPVRTRSDIQESHSCPRESYEIFRDLICPSNSLHAPESNSVVISAQLDQVLDFNRNAIDRLSRLLKCSCAKSGHRAMVHASIVSRILIWYQQAAGWTGNGSSSPHSLVQATGFVVAHVPVTIGTFSIKDKNVQEAFRNQLVLCELKKTANLIDMFISRDQGESPASGGVAGLYSYLGTWLRGEYARTVEILTSSLHAVNENLES